MIVKLNSPKILSDAVSIISELVTEVKIKIKEDGMSIIALDPANVAMVIFRIPRESFSEYQVNDSVWGINLEDLKRILRRTSGSSSIIFEQDGNKLDISIYDKIKRNFMLTLIDIDSDDKNEPNYNFDSEVELNSGDLVQAIEDCSIVAESCAFISGENFFLVEANGSINSFRAEFSKDNAVINGIAKAKYSLEYLTKFIKAQKISERVVIKFSDDQPLRIDFPGEKLGIGFILAPRLEND
jgi:proliferating cell nuclear antigen